MRNRRLAFIAILAAGTLAVCALLRPWSSGPSYQGKSAAQWLKLYRSSSIAEREDARDAFKALGVWFDPAEPHGLNVLIETLRSDPEPARRDFAAYALRQAGPRRGSSNSCLESRPE